MLYRSPITRWCLAAIGVVAGWSLTLGDQDKWRNTPSLHWLARAQIPLQWWGVGFFAYATLLLLPKSRPVGFAFGAALYAVFTVSLGATLWQPGPKNMIVVAAMAAVVVFHLYSIRTAYVFRPDR